MAKKRHEEDVNRARYAMIVEFWRLHQHHDPLDFALGTDEDERKFASWLKLPKLAVTLLDEMNTDGLRCDDLREWERWPDREAFMQTIETESERIGRLLNAEQATGEGAK